MWGEKFLPEPCGDQFTSQSKGLCYGLEARKNGLDLHQSKKINPRTRIQPVAQSTAGRVPVIPAPGTEHSDLQGHKGLAAPVPGFELPSPGTGHQWDPYTPALSVPLPACPLSQPIPGGSGIRKQALPSANPSFTADQLRDLGQVIPPPRLFLNTHKVLSCACDPLHFQATITRGSALWSPYHPWAGEGSALPVHRLGRRGHSHLLSTIKVRSERHRPS